MSFIFFSASSIFSSLLTRNDQEVKSFNKTIENSITEKSLGAKIETKLTSEEHLKGLCKKASEVPVSFRL